MDRPKSKVPSYHAVHTDLWRFRGPAKSYRCVNCGGPAEQWAYSGPSPAKYASSSGEYSDDLSLYEPMCHMCHIRKDKPWTATHCKNGHPRVPENRYFRNGKEANCIPCNREAARRSYLRRAALR